MRFPTAVAATLLFASNPGLANEKIAAQIDAVAPLFNAGALEELGGPQTAEELLEGIDGRWFTLDVTVRNWTSGADPRTNLEESIERLCSDDWENLVTHTALGPTRLRVENRAPDGADNGTFEAQAKDPNSRVFSIEVDDDYVIALLDLEDAAATEQEEELEFFRGDVLIWRPTPDLMVSALSGKVEIWGRCPSS